MIDIFQGMLQGTVLGPLLSNMYVIHMRKTIASTPEAVDFTATNSLSI